MGVIHSAEPFRPAKAVRTSPGHAPFLPPLPSAGFHYSTHGTYSSTIKASPNNPIMARLASFIQISLNSYLISCFKNAQQPLSKTQNWCDHRMHCQQMAGKSKAIPAVDKALSTTRACLEQHPPAMGPHEGYRPGKGCTRLSRHWPGTETSHISAATNTCVR